ncbi:MAG TPA: glycoside hydrolase family 2 TIM barrel-domain containing protein, partial [Tepidisphaeraceae bacterium]|nr:glycoside hydrolase family 2 TIM barrel-domain containing protein [Tepidisphaeraceae bacterium]
MASIDRDHAVIEIETEIRQTDDSRNRVSVMSEVLDPRGKVVMAADSSHFITPGKTTTARQILPELLLPELWHPDHPNLYTLRTTLHLGKRNVLDVVHTRFGLRWFEWTRDRGFFLNGKHVYLRGANAHQDHSGWGIGITQAAIRRDVRLVKEAGMNFVRGAHYPHHPVFARACDEIGLLCWSENCFWGKGGFGPEGYWNASAFPIHEEDQDDFGAHCRQTLVEMIRANRNSPSVICWSMMNEAFFTYHVEQARELVSELVDLSHATDPTRPAASGGCQRGGFDQIGDIAGYNGDGARLFLDPGRPNMVSEYGAISKPPDAFEPFFGDLQAEQFPWRSGQAIWCMFDYGTIAGRQGLKGIVDHARVPKRTWHWYRQAYLNIAPPDAPVDGTPTQLRIEADQTTIIGTDALDDVQLIITLHDDAGRRGRADVPITLTIESGPGELPTGRSITFDNRTDIKHYEGAA